ncbi:DUF6584 family protein [Rhodococcus cercidiphylli]|uniref:DUF6584 family protein n=1 Tax=Rhodococcus cercidiphylli TaxID=489916 RepID=A0ABU4AXB2_9NOCA|nr:DUF6584 family protein [Rhodococcus cercidiphylli]MDV6230882.1 DUF6584 family protein [Rhodococcus cercidiphylli]
MDVIDRAQEDLARGDSIAARDRLVGALVRNPTSPGILELLAYTYLVLGDRAAAGAAWFLTDKSDDDPTASAAFAALEKQYRSPLMMARALPIHAPSDWYPTRARIRLERLGAAIEANGQQWVPPRDVVYFDEDGLNSDDFYDSDLDADDDDFAGARAGACYRTVRQRAIAATIVIAIAATSASVVLALVFG